MFDRLVKRVVEYVKTHKAISVIAGIALIAVLLIVRAVSARAGAQTAGLQTQVVARGSLTATVGATGTARANKSAMLTWGTSGIVEDVFYQVGDEVVKDEYLASLELASMPQNVILAYADLQAAQDALEAFHDSYADLGIAEAQKALADAQDAYENAQRKVNSVTTPGKAVDIDQAFANMVLAEDRLDKARDDYEPYANKPESNLVRANLLLRLTEAQKAYDNAVRIYNSFANPSNQTSISVAEAEMALAAAQLEKAQQDYEEVLDGPTAEALAAAEARVTAAQTTINLGTIKAPFSGIVSDAYPVAGNLVSTGDLAFTLHDMSRLLVDVEVSEIDINHVAVGQQALITFDSVPDKEYSGEVMAVALAGTVTEGAVNFRVTVELLDADELVRPGMTAAVNIIVTELEDVLLVPNRAVRILDGQRVVYAMRNGGVEPVSVTLGASSETHSELLGDAIQAGDVIVINPPTTVFDPSNPPGGGGGQFLFGGNNE
ncbi:MAG: efflux RND transporter periplasmic adaptor subunit [Anaerolineales bacterium]